MIFRFYMQVFHYLRYVALTLVISIVIMLITVFIKTGLPYCLTSH